MELLVKEGQFAKYQKYPAENIHWRAIPADGRLHMKTPSCRRIPMIKVRYYHAVISLEYLQEQFLYWDGSQGPFSSVRENVTYAPYPLIREDHTHPWLKKQGLDLLGIGSLFQHQVVTIILIMKNIQAYGLVVIFTLRYLILNRWYLPIAMRVHVLMGYVGAQWRQLWSEVTCYCVGASPAAANCTSADIMEIDKAGFIDIIPFVPT